MTEVSGLRTTGRTPRPLGEVKDDSSYLHGSNYNERQVTHTGIITTKGTPQKIKEIRESLRHAALINIVAAVNENNSEEGPVFKHNNINGTDNNNNTMTVISNLVLPKDRSISIPTSPVLIEDPKFSKKKPVYFKHSEDEVPKNDADNRKQGILLSRTRNTVPGVAKSRMRTNGTSASPVENGIRKDTPSGERSNVSLQTMKNKLPSPKRYFVAITKRNENEKQATLSKCDAVDIMDTTDNLQNSQIPSNHTVVEKQASSVVRVATNSNMYRAKSFPALFPVKRQKLNSTLSAFKTPSAKAYAGMPNGLIGKNVNSNGENVSGLVSPHINETGENLNDLKKMKSKYVFTRREAITLEGRSIITPVTEANSNRSTPQNHIHKGIIKIPSDGNSKTLLHERDMMKEIDDQFLELQKRIAMKLSSFGENNSSSSISQCDNFSTYGLTGRGFQTQSESSSKTGKREKKRVKFADLSDYDSKVGSDTKSINSNSYWDENGKVVISVQGVGNKIYSPRKGVAFKPMSASELVRLKRRFLPNDYKEEQKPKYDVLGNMRISGMGSRENSQVSGKTLPSKADAKSVLSDTETVSVDINANEFNGKEIDYTDRDCVNLPKSQGMSSFYPHQDNMFQYFADDDGESDDNDSDSEKSYRVLKAVDLQTLSGYQHRKFKRPPALPETTTTHFIKIKVK